MSKSLTPATMSTVINIERARNDLRVVRDELKRNGALTASRAVSKALKSVEGAVRHAYRRQRATDQVPIPASCPMCGGNTDTTPSTGPLLCTDCARATEPAPSTGEGYPSI